MIVTQVVHISEDSPSLFRHRMVLETLDTKDGLIKRIEGSWYPYAAAASVSYGRVTYVGVNENWKGHPAFPNPTKIYEVREYHDFPRNMSRQIAVTDRQLQLIAQACHEWREEIGGMPSEDYEELKVLEQLARSTAGLPDDPYTLHGFCL